MKRLHIVLLSIITLVVIMIVTKPSKERCKEEYKSAIITMTSNEFIKNLDNSPIKDVKLNDRLDLMALDASDEFAKKNWESYYSYSDYFIFCIIKFKGISNSKNIGIGIINSTIKL